MIRELQQRLAQLSEVLHDQEQVRPQRWPCPRSRCCITTQFGRIARSGKPSSVTVPVPVHRHGAALRTVQALQSHLCALMAPNRHSERTDTHYTLTCTISLTQSRLVQTPILTCSLADGCRPPKRTRGGSASPQAEHGGLRLRSRAAAQHYAGHDGAEQTLRLACSVPAKKDMERTQRVQIICMAKMASRWKAVSSCAPLASVRRWLPTVMLRRGSCSPAQV